jgi:hypothetical protein
MTVVGILCCITALPAAAQQGDRRGQDDPKRPVEIVREPKADTRDRDASRNGGNRDVDQGGRKNDGRGKRPGDGF